MPFVITFSITFHNNRNLCFQGNIFRFIFAVYIFKLNAIVIFLLSEILRAYFPVLIVLQTLDSYKCYELNNIDVKFKIKMFSKKKNYQTFSF